LPDVVPSAAYATSGLTGSISRSFTGALPGDAERTQLRPPSVDRNTAFDLATISVSAADGAIAIAVTVLEGHDAPSTVDERARQKSPPLSDFQSRNDPV
jgi:hypothetical protein